MKARFWLIGLALAASGCVSAHNQPLPDRDAAPFHSGGAYDPVLKTRVIAVAKPLFRSAAPFCPSVKTVAPPEQTAFQICNMVAGIYASPVRNAHIEPQEDGSDKIWLSSALIEAIGDDELAFLMAHEMSHRIAGHTIEEGSTPRLELQADAAAQYILARAGFDLFAGESVITRLGIGAGGETQSHPAQADRLAVLAAARKDIEDKKRRGQEIVPPRR